MKLGIAAAVTVVLAVFAGRYGYHGDELYFVAAGKHLAWGYPDQPPLTPFLAGLMDRVAPGSLTALRIPAAIAAGLTVLFTGLLARELGGTRRAQTVAAAAAAVSGLVLVPGHMLHTTTIDICLSAALAWLVARVIRTGNERLLLVAGAVLGLGMLNKYQIAMVAAALVVGLLICGPRHLLRSPWFFGGVAVALLLWSPNLVWQMQNGWPQLEMAKVISDNGGNAVRLSFVPLQLLYVSPFLVPLWVAGLVRLWRTARFFAVAYLLLTALFLVTAGSPLYLFGAYPALLAAGGIAADEWMASRTRKVLVTASIVASAAFVVPMALPVLPTQQAKPLVAMNGLTAEQFGWPELAATVGEAYRNAPANTVIITANFGEAGALERYGVGLPEVYSGYRGYADWGHPPDSATSALIVRPKAKTEPPQWALDSCGELKEVARTHNDLGITNKEHGGKVWLCTNLRSPWSALWPDIRHLT